jgi:D-alanyl-D-alanine carboxypeptidase (penicillin-binding protein 5/6)
MRRRLIPLVLLLVAVFQAVVLSAPRAPKVEAEAAVLMIAGTQRILYAINPDAIMYPASTTKIITALTALEKGKADSVVTISGSAAVCDGSSLELQPGDRLRLRDLLYGMMLVSGNDAAEAVAEHIAGSVPAFVALMNAKARQLGAASTHFSNPHGLPDPTNHYTTAKDLAVITSQALQNPEFRKIVATRDFSVPLLNRPPLQISNTNKLLKSYPGANGVKTGYTEAAGDCLVAAATRGSVQLVVVLLNDDERWTDAANLLDYGFAVAGTSTGAVR